MRKAAHSSSANMHPPIDMETAQSSLDIIFESGHLSTSKGLHDPIPGMLAREVEVVAARSLPYTASQDALSQNARSFVTNSKREAY